MHEKRAEVIAELYGLLVEANWAVAVFVSPIDWAEEPSKQEKYVSAMNSVAAFFRFFEKHRIYLPPELCEGLETFVREMRKRAIGFGVYVSHDDGAMPEAALDKMRTAWMEASEYMDAQVPPSRAALEAELRGILGAA